eukprot:15330624-Ditylum_brightwellii.AAC.1
MSLSDKYRQNNEFVISAIEHDASYPNLEDSFVQPTYVLSSKEEGKYVHLVSIDSSNVGDVYLWSGKTSCKFEK